MTAQAALPPGLTSDDIHYILEWSDVNLNSTILLALTTGFYTGVLGVTFWGIFGSSTKNSSIGRCVIIVTIFVLYTLTIFNFGEYWAFMHYAFIDEGQNCYTVFIAINGFDSIVHQAMLVNGIASCISTFIADTLLIWRCWIVWGCQWLIVIIPVLCTVLGAVFKGIMIYHMCSDSTNDMKDSTYSGTIAEWQMLYLALTLITTLWCTIFILYRILHVAGSGHGAGICSYYGVIEALVESAALYSAILIIDIVFAACDISSGIYVDVLGIDIRGIAPTLLVGRVAAGHARPDDSWSISTVSSLNFGTSTVSTQDGDVSQSDGLDEIDNLDPGSERNSALIEEVAQEARSLDIV